MVNNGELPEYQLRHILTISYKVHAEATQFVPGLTKQEAYNQVLDNAKALFDGQRNWVDTAPKHSYVANGSLTRCGKIIYPGTELGKVDDCPEATSQTPHRCSGTHTSHYPVPPIRSIGPVWV